MVLTKNFNHLAWFGNSFVLLTATERENPITKPLEQRRCAQQLELPNLVGGFSSASKERCEDRGRDAHYWAPPAQIRTCPIKASGSRLGYLTAKR
jgi:hypothetical protein